MLRFDEMYIKRKTYLFHQCILHSYTKHSVHAFGEDLLDFFHNSEHLPSTQGQYSTDLYAAKTIDILKTQEEASFIYLSFNAPHEPVSAPDNLIEKIKKLHPNTPYTRLGTVIWNQQNIF